MRKVIAISAIPWIDRREGEYAGQVSTDIDQQLFALCDDGTMWMLNSCYLNGSWNLLPDIPQEFERSKKDGS